MTPSPNIDAALVQWGERLFFPRVRQTKTLPAPRLNALASRRASVIRNRIAATVSRRALQVMVKVTGGGRGMAAIAAHFRYISKNGRLDIEDERGVVDSGKEALHDLVDRWRHGGSLIEEISARREAFNVMLSMPQGTDPRAMLHAARAFAKVELKDHAYVMVLHEHQANPHVHLAVRAESKFGTRLNPRKSDLHRWRETFAEKLRDLGIEAEATRRVTRGATRTSTPLWQLKAQEEGRAVHRRNSHQRPNPWRASQVDAMVAWTHIAQALGESERPEDRKLSGDVRRFIKGAPVVKEREADAPPQMTPAVQRQKRNQGPEIGR